MDPTPVFTSENDRFEYFKKQNSEKIENIISKTTTEILLLKHEQNDLYYPIRDALYAFVKSLGQNCDAKVLYGGPHFNRFPIGFVVNETKFLLNNHIHFYHETSI